MNNKHKIFILLFIGVFGFVIFRGWVFVKTKYLPAVANIDTKGQQIATDSDFDNDGLSDIEESFYSTDYQNPDTDGDGYLDGEEVASGYNPRLSSPNDAKPGAISRAAPDINLTDRLMGRLYASIDQGEIDLGDPEALDITLESIAYNTTLESLPIFYTADIEESSIIILYEYTDQEMQEYVNKLFRIINDRLLIRSAGQMARLEEMLKNFDENSHAFRDEAQYYLPHIEGAINELLALPAPKPWVSSHMETIDMVRSFKPVNEALETSDNDILKAFVVSQKIIDLNLEFSELFTDLVLLVDEHDLVLPDIALIKLYKDILGL